MEQRRAWASCWAPHTVSFLMLRQGHHSPRALGTPCSDPRFLPHVLLQVAAASCSRNRQVCHSRKGILIFLSVSLWRPQEVWPPGRGMECWLILPSYFQCLFEEIKVKQAVAFLKLAINESIMGLLSSKCSCSPCVYFWVLSSLSLSPFFSPFLTLSFFFFLRQRSWRASGPRGWALQSADSAWSQSCCLQPATPMHSGGGASQTLLQCSAPWRIFWIRTRAGEGWGRRPHWHIFSLSILLSCLCQSYQHQAGPCPRTPALPDSHLLISHAVGEDWCHRCSFFL